MTMRSLLRLTTRSTRKRTRVNYQEDVDEDDNVPDREESEAEYVAGDEEESEAELYAPPKREKQKTNPLAADKSNGNRMTMAQLQQENKALKKEVAALKQQLEALTSEHIKKAPSAKATKKLFS